MITTIRTGNGTALLTIAGIAAPAFARDYTIGAPFPLSGPRAVYGDIFMPRSDLAVEHINAD